MGQLWGCVEFLACNKNANVSCCVIITTQWKWTKGFKHWAHYELTQKLKRGPFKCQGLFALVLQGSNERDGRRCPGPLRTLPSFSWEVEALWGSRGMMTLRNPVIAPESWRSKAGSAWRGMHCSSSQQKTGRRLSESHWVSWRLIIVRWEEETNSKF